MLLEVVLQNEWADRRALTVPRDNERTTVVEVREVIIKRGDYVFVRRGGECRAYVSVFLPSVCQCLYACPAVIRHEQIGRILIRACHEIIIELLNVLHHFEIVECGIIGIALVEAHVLRRADKKRVDAFGVIRNFVPT